MPPEVDDRASLVDMLEFAREAVAFTRNRTRADLDRLQDVATVRQVLAPHGCPNG